MDRNGGIECDLRVMTGKVIVLNKIWKSREISLATKLRLLNSNVKMGLMCVSETWDITKSILQ